MDFADDFGVGDFFALFERDVFVVEDVECVSALDAFVGPGIVGANALTETTKFVGVRLTPDWSKFGVCTELLVFEGQTSVMIKDRGGTFGGREGRGMLATGHHGSNYEG